MMKLHSNLSCNIRRIIFDEKGATAIEYAIIAAGVSVAIVGAVTSLGSEVRTTLYDKIATALQ